MDCIRALVELGAEREARDKVRAATRYQAWRRIRLLTLAACNAWQEGITPLALAASEGEVDCIRALVELGAKLEARDNVRAATRYQAWRRVMLLTLAGT